MRLIIINRKALILLLAIIILVSFLGIAFKKSKNVFNQFNPVYKGSDNEKVIAFACNVVWGNEYLPDMLRVFKKNDIRISFFFGGDWVNKNKELLLSINADGHEIGNHGYNHLKPTQISKKENIEEILKTERIIKEVLDKRTRLFAPPYGDINDRVVGIAKSLGYKVIMYSVDTIDWDSKNHNVILNRVNKKIHNGDIVLIHPTESVVKVLPIMINNFKNSDFKIVTVGELL